MERINFDTVRLTEGEQVIQEWHDALMSKGLNRIEALDEIMSHVPVTESTTWKLLSNQDFRLWLMH